MPAAIFSGSKVKSLKDTVTLNDAADIIASSTDPSSSPVSAPAGSLLLNTSNGNAYLKQDSGSSTNWNLVTQGTSSNTVNPGDLKNLGVSLSVTSNTLVFALKQSDGTDPDSSSPVSAVFRNATITNGQVESVDYTGATSITVPDGGTLGHASSRSCVIYLYLINNSGTGKLGISTSRLDEGSLHTSVALSTGSDSNNVLYSDAVYSSKAIRLVGMAFSNQTTAGTWASAPSELSVVPFDNVPVSLSAYRSGNQTIATATTTTVAYNAVNSDRYNILNTSTGVATVPVAGLYLVDCGVSFNLDSTGSRQIDLVIGGSTGVANTSSDGYVNVATRINVSRLLALSAGDTVEARATQSSGGNLDVSGGNNVTWFSIVRVGR